MILVISGPGGAGKGTVASKVVESVPGVWLSRSWTTRPRRAGEPADSYEFVDHDRFQKKIAEGGFLEWAEFLGHLYGTPRLEPPPGMDVLLEIDLQGAVQVLETKPDSVLVLLLPPSKEVQAQRLRARGDSEEEVRNRLEKGEEEERVGRGLAPHVVVNDQVDRAVSEIAGILEAHRRAAPAS